MIRYRHSLPSELVRLARLSLGVPDCQILRFEKGESQKVYLFVELVFSACIVAARHKGALTPHLLTL